MENNNEEKWDKKEDDNTSNNPERNAQISLRNKLSLRNELDVQRRGIINQHLGGFDLALGNLLMITIQAKLQLAQEAAIKFLLYVAFGMSAFSLLKYRLLFSRFRLTIRLKREIR